MVKWLISLFGLLLLVLISICPVSGADGYYNGYVENGYTYRDGYWYYGNQAYTREWRPYTYYASSSYGYGGYAYPYTGYKWYYYEYNPPKVATTSYSLPSPNDPSWRGKLLDIAKQRDAVEGQMRLSALDNALYLEAVNALGLRSNFSWQQYGTAPPYPSNTYGQGGYNQQATNYQLGSYGANANTLYGTQVATMAQIYGAADMSALLQQSAKLTQNAQELAGQAHGQFIDAVTREGGNRARVAEILAKQQAAMGVIAATGQAAAQALTAAEGQSAKVYQSTTTFGNGVSGSVNGNVNDGSGPQVLPAKKIPINQAPAPNQVPNDGNGNGGQARLNLNHFRDVTMDKYCVSCHNATDKVAKLDLTKGYETFDDELKDAIWERVTTNNPDKRMPAAPKGGTAAQMAEQEIMIFERPAIAKKNSPQ